MSTVCPVPSQVDPSGLDDLIADARCISLPHQLTADLVHAEAPGAVVIPAASVDLVEEYDDYV